MPRKKSRLPSCSRSSAALAPTRPKRARQIDKIKLDEIKASSRQNPFIRFEQEKKLFHNSLQVEQVTQGFETSPPLFHALNMMQKPNILLMDEPTNHLDMESIESLPAALELYQGTLLFVSHDREFVSSLETRIVEILPDRVVDFSGNDEDYLRSQGVN